MGVLTLVLGFWRLSLNGLGNLYYTAANISGAQSFRNMFFAAFDPAGIMAVDKPPLGLVPSALSVKAFGLSSWSVLGPQVVLFALGVAITQVAVTKWFGRRAGLIASIVLLLTPIDLAVARSNNPDEMLVLLTIVGLLCTVQALRTDLLRWVVGAGTAVGLAFTTKQLQAIVGVPAIPIALVIFGTGSLRHRHRQTSVFCSVAAIVCLAWIVVVDHVSKAIRPYVANTTNDTEYQLAFGFNGTHRIAKLHASPTVRHHRLRVTNSDVFTAFGRTVVRELGLARNLFSSPFVHQGGWLLAASLVGGTLTAWRLRSSVIGRIAGFLLLWTLIHTVVLSLIPGKFSPYYLAPLIPGVAVLVAVVLETAWVLSYDQRKSHRRFGVGLGMAFLVSSAGTALYASTGLLRWIVVFASITCLGIWSVWLRLPGALSQGWVANGKLPPRLSKFIVITSVFTVAVAPARWSAAAIALPQNRIAPSASLKADVNPTNERRVVAANDELLLGYAQRMDHAAGFATPRVLVAARGVERGMSIVPLGGYFGTDPFPRLNTLQQLVRDGKVRWVAVPVVPLGISPGKLDGATIAKPWGPYARTHCTLVPPLSYLLKGHWWQTQLLARASSTSPLALYDCHRLLGVS